MIGSLGRFLVGLFVALLVICRGLLWFLHFMHGVATTTIWSLIIDFLTMYVMHMVYFAWYAGTCTHCYYMLHSIEVFEQSSKSSSRLYYGDHSAWNALNYIEDINFTSTCSARTHSFSFVISCLFMTMMGRKLPTVQNTIIYSTN